LTAAEVGDPTLRFKHTDDAIARIDALLADAAALGERDAVGRRAEGPDLVRIDAVGACPHATVQLAGPHPPRSVSFDERDEVRAWRLTHHARQTANGMSSGMSCMHRTAGGRSNGMPSGSISRWPSVELDHRAIDHIAKTSSANLRMRHVG
jgi:hypothetical protein